MKVAGGQLHCVSGAVQRKLHGGRVREGDTPSCWGGGGSRQIFKFCILRDAFSIWCIFRAKKSLFGGHCKLNYKQEFSSKYHSDITINYNNWN